MTRSSTASPSNSQALVREYGGLPLLPHVRGVGKGLPQERVRQLRQEVLFDELPPLIRARHGRTRAAIAAAAPPPERHCALQNRRNSRRRPRRARAAAPPARYQSRGPRRAVSQLTVWRNQALAHGLHADQRLGSARRAEHVPVDGLGGRYRRLVAEHLPDGHGLAAVALHGAGSVGVDIAYLPGAHAGIPQGGLQRRDGAAPRQAGGPSGGRRRCSSHSPAPRRRSGRRGRGRTRGPPGPPRRRPRP